MFSRILGCTIMSLALGGLALEAGGTKDKTTTLSKKGFVGTIKSVNMSEHSFHVTLEDKSAKVMKFMVTDHTKFIGPKGGNRGMGKEGLKDDCMAKGYMVRVVAGKTTLGGHLAAEVHLSTRMSEKKTDDKKDQ